MPESIPQPFREIAVRCLQADPRQRCTAADILAQIRTQTLPAKPPQTKPVSAKTFEADPSQPRSKWRIRTRRHRRAPAPSLGRQQVHVPSGTGSAPAAETRPANAPPPTAETHPANPASTLAPVQTPVAKPPATAVTSEKPAQKGVVRGSVLQQVLPDVSRGAQNTVQGHVKLSVQGGGCFRKRLTGKTRLSRTESTLRIMPWRRPTAGSSLHRREMGKPPLANGFCAFNLDGQAPRCFRQKPNLRASQRPTSSFFFIFQTICRNMPSRNSASPVCKSSRRTKRRSAPSKESDEFNFG